MNYSQFIKFINSIEVYISNYFEGKKNNSYLIGINGDSHSDDYQGYFYCNKSTNEGENRIFKLFITKYINSQSYISEQNKDFLGFIFSFFNNGSIGIGIDTTNNRFKIYCQKKYLLSRLIEHRDNPLVFSTKELIRFNEINRTSNVFDLIGIDFMINGNIDLKFYQKNQKDKIPEYIQKHGKVKNIYDVYSLQGRDKTDYVYTNFKEGSLYTVTQEIKDKKNTLKYYKFLKIFK